MLTAELVRARKRSGKLTISPLKGERQRSGQELAEVLLAQVRELVGARYGQLREAWETLAVGPRDKKLAMGLQKLIEDDCEFEEVAPLDPRRLRSEVFGLAAERRRELGDQFTREQVLESVAERYGVSLAQVQEGLYADLRSEHIVRRVSDLTPEQLMARYELAQYQAVLLRASHVTAWVRCGSAAGYRDLFRALKFRRLLYEVAPCEGGYRIEISGPYSLFDSVTKYGLQLALVFPWLQRCDSLRLEAKLRWGKSRERLSFEYQSDRPRHSPGEQPTLPEEVQTLLERLRARATKWSIEVNEELLDLPGVGVCIPDLVFSRGTQRVYVEVMGYWSREAVWKRVDLVRQGLPQKVLFALSSRLRVSEAVLEESEHGALYVYKGVMSARAVLERVERLCQ